MRDENLTLDTLVGKVMGDGGLDSGLSCYSTLSLSLSRERIMGSGCLYCKAGRVLGSSCDFSSTAKRQEKLIKIDTRDTHPNGMCTPTSREEEELKSRR